MNVAKMRSDVVLLLEKKISSLLNELLNVLIFIVMFINKA